MNYYSRQFGFQDYESAEGAFGEGQTQGLPMTQRARPRQVSAMMNGFGV